MVETHSLTHAHCLYIIDVEWKVLHKMAVICQILIIQPHKHKYRERYVQENHTHSHTGLYEAAPHLEVNAHTLLSFSTSDSSCCLWPCGYGRGMKSASCTGPRAGDSEWLHWKPKANTPGALNRAIRVHFVMRYG